MKNKIGIYFVVAAVIALLYSCSGKKITGEYYLQHQRELDKIELTFWELYRQQPFSLSFSDRAFRTISLEIHTDTLTYIYDFLVNDPRIKDTLTRYNLSATGVTNLIGLMQQIRCTWVNHFDYYIDQTKKSLIFISVKPVAIQSFFSATRYYIITYYSQPQLFDSEGRLLDKKRPRRLRRINGEIFHRINDTVCYAVSGQFR